MEASLRDMLKYGRKFERLRTEVPGIFIRLIPQLKGTPPYLAVEINPLGVDGLPINKIGPLIKSKSELDEVRTLLSKIELEEILQTVERVNQS